MRPTSVDFTGTNATINADGGVDLDACTVFSLNGVFTSAYDNYTILFNGTPTQTTEYMKLRASGTDNSTNYHYQNMNVTDTSSNAFRDGPVTTGVPLGEILNVSNVYWVNVYGPSLAQETVFRSSTFSTRLGAYLWVYSGVHAVSTSYDGFSRPSGNAFTGTVHVYAYEE